MGRRATDRPRHVAKSVTAARHSGNIWQVIITSKATPLSKSWKNVAWEGTARPDSGADSAKRLSRSNKKDSMLGPNASTTLMTTSLVATNCLGSKSMTGRTWTRMPPRLSTPLVLTRTRILRHLQRLSQARLLRVVASETGNRAAARPV